jgi:hypothetical protein
MIGVADGVMLQRELARQRGVRVVRDRSPGWESDAARALDPFPMIAQHVLARHAAGVDEAMARALTPDVLERIVGWIPDDWLTAEPGAAALKAAYTRYLVDRLQAPRTFVEEAARAR